ncbi:MAG: hypothetical protein HRT51_05860 [Colwellia sp.]|nr:hypothetical protein [Colwellia sp.]
MKINIENNIEVLFIGQENTPILIIDNFVTEPDALMSLAGDDNPYYAQPSDYYPGIRKPVPASYGELIGRQLFDLLKNTYQLKDAVAAKTILSAFSISTTPPKQLRPIQMLPHFDSTADNQFALVHYLCDVKHGGTAFYRHKKTGHERITTTRFPQYATLLKQQAKAANLHQSPAYIANDSSLFERIHGIDARNNRVVIYPSNLLHSGNIQPQHGLSSDPRKGRLTISSFVCIS